VCPGRIVDNLPKTVSDADFLSCGSVSGPVSGPRFSVTAQLTHVQSFVSGCSSVCSTDVFTCGPMLGDCLVLATAPGAGGLDLAIVPISFTTAHPPTMTVTPTLGLADGQTLTVSVTGFARFEQLGIIECESPRLPKLSQRPPRCTPFLALFGADSSGSASATFRVRRLIGPLDAKQPLDCATLANGCVIQATMLSLQVPVHFDPAMPIVRPKLTVTPHSGLTDGQTVTIRGTNFAVGSVTLHECKAGASTIGNTGVDAISRLLEVCSTVAAFLPTDQSGNFETTLAVLKHSTNFNNVPIDCTTGCVIDAGFFPSERFHSGFLDVPITFGTPTRGSDCRRGGWRTLVDEHGRPFRNAGHCLAWLEDHAP
jgi:hypothetical protein